MWPIDRVALDLQPHPGSTANAMLGNLASMAAREVDTPSTDMPEPQEWYTNGVFLPATLRTVLDNYSWATFLLDTTQPRWPVLYVNIAFQTMTGWLVSRTASCALSAVSILSAPSVSAACLKSLQERH